ncbi:GtrA family protein [Sulfurimonas sp. MAG313]|nr:GtrA family protein [Sulfurimonas sp. MAG313]
MTNLMIFSVMTLMNVNYNLASTAAFLVAVTQNFSLNKKWTFKDHNSQENNKFIKYVSLNFLSFLGNLLVLNLVVYSFGEDKLIQILGQLIGIGVAMGFNFLVSYLFIFKKFKEEVE